MNVSVNWHNPQKDVIYVHFQPGWTWHDFWQMNDEFIALANTVDHPVVLIVDLTDAGMPSLFAQQMKTIAHTSQAERPKNLAYTIVVGLKGLLEIAINIFNKVYSHATSHVVFVATVEEALETITQRGET